MPTVDVLFRIKLALYTRRLRLVFRVTLNKLSACITYQALFIGVVLHCQLFVVVGIHTTHVTKMALRVCQKHKKENNTYLIHSCITH